MAVLLLFQLCANSSQIQFRVLSYTAKAMRGNLEIIPRSPVLATLNQLNNPPPPLPVYILIMSILT